MKNRIYLAPDNGGAASPSVAGATTMAARAERSADERPLSEQNAEIVPELDMILGNLNMGGIKLDNHGEEITTPAADPAPEGDGDEDPTDTTDPTDEDPTDPTDPTDEDPADDADPKPDAKGVVPEAVQERIDQLTRQKHELRDERDTLKEALTATKQQLDAISAAPARQTPTAEQPLAHIVSMEELGQMYHAAQEAKMWAIANAEGAEVVVDPKTGETEYYDAARIRKILVKAETDLAAAPQRQEQLIAHQRNREQFQMEYAEAMTDGERERHANIRRALPQISSMPNGDMIIADAMVGQALRQGDSKALLAFAEKLLAKAKAGGAAKSAIPAPVKKVHAAPVHRPAPKAPARTVEQRHANSSMNSSKGDNKSILRFAERLVGV